MNKREGSYYGPDILKGRDLTREFKGSGRFELNEANSDYTFLKLGGMVATHNKDKVDFVEVCLIEEMSELTKALCKIRRDEADFSNTIEELGHVILMCYALISKYNFRYETVIKEAEDAVGKMKSSHNKDKVYYRMRGNKNENN